MEDVELQPHDKLINLGERVEKSLGSLLKNDGVFTTSEKMNIVSAFIHKSFSTKHTEDVSKFFHSCPSADDNNERLSILGARVLQLSFLSHLSKKRTYTTQEDTINKVVSLTAPPACRSHFTRLKININPLHYCSDVLEIKSRSFEALVGSIYQCFGYDKTDTFIKTHLFDKEYIEKALLSDPSIDYEKLVTRGLLENNFPPVKERIAYFKSPGQVESYTCYLSWIDQKDVAVHNSYTKNEARRTAFRNLWEETEFRNAITAFSSSLALHCTDFDAADRHSDWRSKLSDKIAEYNTPTSPISKRGGATIMKITTSTKEVTLFFQSLKDNDEPIFLKCPIYTTSIVIPTFGDEVFSGKQRTEDSSIQSACHEAYKKIEMMMKKYSS